MRFFLVSFANLVSVVPRFGLAGEGEGGEVRVQVRLRRFGFHFLHPGRGGGSEVPRF